MWASAFVKLALLILWLTLEHSSSAKKEGNEKDAVNPRVNPIVAVRLFKIDWDPTQFSGTLTD